MFWWREECSKTNRDEARWEALICQMRPSAGKIVSCLINTVKKNKPAKIPY